jgi:guanylate kinase
MEKVIIFSAPSGSGKTTIVHQLLERYPQFEFSISATSRAPRGQEKNGVDYYFLTEEEFLNLIEKDAFVEWEAVYAGTHYGTLRSEVERIWSKGNVIIFDVDVVGGVNLKRIFGDKARSIFIMPPSVEELERRLVGRGTDTAEVIAKRVAKAEIEIARAPEFDHIVVNDVLEQAVAQTVEIIDKFIAQ